MGRSNQGENVMATFFGFKIFGNRTETELPRIFPLSVDMGQFVETDVINVYSKILTDCVERTQGIQEKYYNLLWDNCLQNESSHGLITLLATAMADKSDLFLVYVPAVNVLRKADSVESTKIRQDYKAKGISESGVYISFKNYTRTDMVKIYSILEYCVVGSLHKQMNLSKSIQFKMSEMRSSVSLTDKAKAELQARAIARSLSGGFDVMMDKNDEIVTATPDISATKESIGFIDSKKAFYYNMPLSYIDGEQTPGIGSTGEADTRAVERGLKQYYISIIKPTLEALFGVKTSFKSNDFRMIASGLEALKTFELVQSDDLISSDDKKLIVSKLFDLSPVSE